jgi:bifunctional non-homologous end joining protein LigD
MASQPKEPAAIGAKALVPSFVKPSLPSKVTKPPSGSLWVHEIKRDGYRLMVRKGWRAHPLLHPQRQ